MPKTPPSQGNRTPARQYRLDADTLAMLDALRDHYGFTGQADAIRVAVRGEFARLGLTLPAPAKKKGEKKSE